jgi:hypothetical protein
MCFVFVTLAMEAHQLPQNIKKTLTFEAFKNILLLVNACQTIDGFLEGWFCSCDSLKRKV